MNMKHVAFATCRQLPSIKSDEQPVATLLWQQGVEVESVFWDNRNIRWDDFDTVVIRTCWDYHLRPAEFLSWIKETSQKGVQFWNPPQVLEWNSNKHYLKELATRGVQTIPTEWIGRGSSVKLDQILAGNRWSDAVVKPTVSASAYQTWRTCLETARCDQTRLEQMVTQSDVMVQPFMPEISTKGEWSLIFFQGQFSHAVVKKPQSGDFRVQPDYGGTSLEEKPSNSLIEQAKKIVDKVDAQLLYARVDGIEIDGTFFLMELELLEPNLFLGVQNQADQRFAQAILSLIA